MTSRETNIEKAIEVINGQIYEIMRERNCICYTLANRPRIDRLDEKIRSLQFAVDELEKVVA